MLRRGPSTGDRGERRGYGAGDDGTALAIGDPRRRGLDAARARRSGARGDARATGSSRRSRPASAILDEGGSAVDAVEAARPRARGRSLLQRRARQRADRAGRGRARRGDHGRARPRAPARSPGSHDARADQPRAAADGAGPARLPVGRRRRPVRRERGLEQVDERLVRDCPSAGASSTKLLAAGGVRRRRSNTARSARSRSTCDGHVAAATSTGGLTAKRWGRVGNSPLIGAGTYADDRSAAVSATGSGEYFIRAVAAHQLAERVRLGGEPLQQALDGVLADIAVARRQGRADRGRARSAKRPGASPRRRCIAAWPTPSGRTVAIYSDEDGAVGQVAPQPVDLAARSPSRSASRKSRDRLAEARVGNEMRRSGDHRLIAARELVLALRAGLDARPGRARSPIRSPGNSRARNGGTAPPRCSPSSGRRACPAPMKLSAPAIGVPSR